MREVNGAIASFKGRNKTPGSDGISTLIIWVMHRCDPKLLLIFFNLCLRTETFPERREKSRVVLLRKGNKPERVPYPTVICAC